MFSFSKKSFLALMLVVSWTLHSVPVLGMQHRSTVDRSQEAVREEAGEIKVHSEPRRSLLQRGARVYGYLESFFKKPALNNNNNQDVHNIEGDQHQNQELEILLSENCDDLQENSGPTPLYEKIADESLRAVEQNQEDSATATLNALINDDKEFYQLLEEALEKSIHAPTALKRAAIFNLFTAYETQNPEQFSQSNVLDETSWKDLELLSGPKTCPSLCIASKIDRASTEAGRAVLYRKIIQPSADINQILAQQHNVHMLLDHNDFFESVDVKLKELSKTESAVLSFFGEDLFYSILLQRIIKIIGQGQVNRIKKLADYLNKQELFLEVNDQFSTILGNGQTFLTAIAAPTLVLYGLCQLIGFESPEFLHDYSIGLNLGPISKFTILGGIVYFTRWLYQSNSTDGLVNGIDGLTGLQSVYRNRNDFKTIKTFTNGMQTKLIDVATYMNNMRAVVQEALSYQELSDLPMIKNLKKTFDEFLQDPEMKHLLDLLATSTFKGEASFFSYKGRVYSAYKLMYELKHKLAPLMAAVGELDAQMSIARLYKEFEHKRITFCFPTLIGGEKTPAMKITDFWNPAVDENVVVANSIELGDQYNHRRNIAVSGPNAGGKTTITARGIPICVILAQSLGIAPAREFEFTPFTKIITYLNITDDLAQGNSKFTAGVTRALEVLDVAKNTNDGFSLTAVDEALDGASYNESQASAYALFEAIGKCKNNICLTTTHLPSVGTLEDAGLFSNYKVSVDFDENGKICYRYKLEAGRTHQNIVFNVLREKGFNQEFLTRSTQKLDELTQNFNAI